MNKGYIKPKYILRIASSLLVVAIALAGVISINTSATAMTVQYHGPAEISQYIFERNVNIFEPIVFEREPNIQSNDQGALSQKTLVSALNMTNTVRHISGLDEVALDNNYIYCAQLAAFVCKKYNTLDHYIYDDSLGDKAEAAYQGVQHCNLASGGSGLLNHSIVGWMSSPAHRRWMQDPCLHKTGFGATIGYHSIYVIDYYEDWDNGIWGDFENEELRDTIRGIAWPSVNMPIEYFDRLYPWSVSLGKMNECSNVSVSLTNVNTGQKYNFNRSDSNVVQKGEYIVKNDNAGQAGYVCFWPEGIESINNGDVYEVTINGLDSDLFTDKSLSYRVNFFSLFNVHPSSAPDVGGMGDMYRMFNGSSGEHFYTNSIIERDNLVIAGWYYENIEWNAPTSDGDPVYRLYNPYSGDHHYTLYTVERDALVNVGWIYEGEAWKSNNSGNGTPVYRLFNPNAQTASHHYTTNVGERDYLILNGWLDEGIGWYGN